MQAIRAFIVNNPLLAATLASLWGAILVDLMAFKDSKDPGSFFQTFSFKVAGWRYAQSIVAGFIGNAVVAGVAAGAGAGVAMLIYFW